MATHYLNTFLLPCLLCGSLAAMESSDSAAQKNTFLQPMPAHTGWSLQTLKSFTSEFTQNKDLAIIGGISLTASVWWLIRHTGTRAWVRRKNCLIEQGFPACLAEADIGEKLSLAAIVAAILDRDPVHSFFIDLTDWDLQRATGIIDEKIAALEGVKTMAPPKKWKTYNAPKPPASKPADDEEIGLLRKWRNFCQEGFSSSSYVQLRRDRELLEAMFNEAARNPSNETILLKIVLARLERIADKTYSDTESLKLEQMYNQNKITHSFEEMEARCKEQLSWKIFSES